MITFEQNETYMPLTMSQFEELTNEFLVQMNTLLTPHALDADYMAQVLMSALHGLDHKLGIINKTDVFNSCVNRISCHVTYHAVEEIQKRLKAKADESTSKNLQLVDEDETTDTAEPPH